MATVFVNYNIHSFVYLFYRLVLVLFDGLVFVI